MQVMFCLNESLETSVCNVRDSNLRFCFCKVNCKSALTVFSIVTIGSQYYLNIAAYCLLAKQCPNVGYTGMVTRFGYIANNSRSCMLFSTRMSFLYLHSERL